MVQDLTDLGAVAVGVCRHPLGYSENLLDLDTAETVLLDDDGWLENWHRTNDVEYHLPLDDQYPSILIVRLSDMKVLVFTSANNFTPSTDLLPILENPDSY